MFEIDGKNYVLKYNLERVELIESVSKLPMMPELYEHKGVFGIQALKTYLAYGLKDEGADSFVPPRKGLEMAKALIESEGYMTVNGAVLESLQRDCPFFFQDA